MSDPAELVSTSSENTLLRTVLPSNERIDRMGFNLLQWQEMFQRELLDALRGNRDRIAEMVREETVSATGTMAVDGISFDILPGHRFVAISFRLGSDEREGEPYRYSPADWKHYEFIGDDAFQLTRDAIGTSYEQLPEGLSKREVTHLMLVAAAEALLSPEVASMLQTCGINAPIVVDTIPDGKFEYMVLDEDKVILANLCEVTLAQRHTRALLDRLHK